ncbi:MAG: hypothetical protein SP1CHLAM54_01900 [Chlamydiia bacterium]|nr:hypothetical protein [Chlamydiia bacterium]MCH9615108.1 hypothetical protein [Chlamydiia bacterium]MCH9628570.1 hypothetical protein [Chlamydiia bacterium]
MSKIMLAVSIFTSALHSLPVTERYEKVCELAKVYQKMYVLAFTGSDWADPVSLLTDEVSSNALMVVQVDFPELNRQDILSLERNAELKERYSVDTFPTLVLCDESGEEVARFQDAPLSKLCRIESEYLTLRDQFKRNGSTLEIFNQAKALGATSLADKIMESGLSDNNPEFLLERFAELVAKQEGESEEARDIFATLSAVDPDNRKGLLYRASLLAYQAEGSERPLLSLLAHLGNNKEMWKIHLLICEHLVDKDETKEAVKHAHLCMDRAPEEERSNISLLLSSIGIN